MEFALARQSIASSSAIVPAVPTYSESRYYATNNGEKDPEYLVVQFFYARSK